MNKRCKLPYALNAGDFKCTITPWFCNSTRPQNTLHMFGDHCGPRQTTQWETINQGLLQPQGELYPFETIFNHCTRDLLFEFRTSFYETISGEFLIQGNFKHTQFSWNHWNMTGLELATSRTQSERRIDWANLTAYSGPFQPLQYMLSVNMSFWHGILIYLPWTSTVTLQLAVLPASSWAVQVDIDVPSGNRWYLLGLHSNLATWPESSDIAKKGHVIAGIILYHFQWRVPCMVSLTHWRIGGCLSSDEI